MKIGGHGIREHLRLLSPAFALVAGVWLLRLIMWEAGTPIGLTRLVSVTVATMAAILLSVILIHSRRFGSYASIVVTSLLINIWAQLLIILSILFTILTGKDNVYAAPEFTLPGNETGQWAHVHGHVTFGIGIGTLFGAAVGCLLLWLLRTIVPETKDSHQNTTQSIGS